MKILTFDLSRVMEHTVAPSTVEDCVDAFRELGHEVMMIDCSLSDTKQLEDIILKFRPDFVFALNTYCLIPELLTRLRIPYVSWFGDNPFHVIKNLNLSPYYTIFVCDRAYIKPLYEAGFRYVYYLPYGSNPAVFRSVRLSKEDIERFGCDISFAGASLYSAIKRYDEIIGNINIILRWIIDDVIRIQIDNPTLDVSDILKGVEEGKGCSIFYKDKQYKRYIEIWLEYTAMARYRQEIIRELASFTLNLYGDDGWKESLRDVISSGGIRFLGWADNRKELVKIYNASKINLNISKAQAKTTFPMRVFDITCAGGFLLTDFRECLPEFFIPDKEVVSYRRKEELRELVEYFLSHPRERREIAKAAQERVLSEHTFKKRMDLLIDTMIREKRL